MNLQGRKSQVAESGLSKAQKVDQCGWSSRKGWGKRRRREVSRENCRSLLQELREDFKRLKYEGLLGGSVS